MTTSGRWGETIAAQAGHFIDPANSSVTPPIQPSVTFARDTEYALIDPAFNYGRGNNPTTATSLGGVESLVEHCATIEGPESHLPENLLRLSIGIDDVHELIGDLEYMLSGAS